MDLTLQSKDTYCQIGLKAESNNWFSLRQQSVVYKTPHNQRQTKSKRLKTHSPGMWKLKARSSSSDIG
jgi:hypothetical protein